MSLKNSFNLINEFFSTLFNQFRNLYLRSSLYNKKISKIENNSLIYKPSLSILSCLIKYNKKKIKIEELNQNYVWENKNLNIETLKLV